MQAAGTIHRVEQGLCDVSPLAELTRLRRLTIRGDVGGHLTLPAGFQRLAVGETRGPIPIDGAVEELFVVDADLRSLPKSHTLQTTPGNVARQPIRRSLTNHSSMENTAEFLIDDILNPYSQMTLGVIEDGATDTEIRKRGRGIIDTLDEAQGDMLADADELRRADVELTITDIVSDAVGWSELGDPSELTLPSDCEERRSRDWALVVNGVFSAGEVGIITKVLGTLVRHSRRTKHCTSCISTIPSCRSSLCP